MSVEICHAEAAAWPEIARLVREAELPLAGALDHLDQFLVAVRGDRVIGCIGLELYEGVALLRSVAVAEDESGRGIGKSLVTAQLARARNLGVGKIYLLTTTAATYFEKFGFHELRPEDAAPLLGASAEFQGACPASATLMELELRAVGPDHR